MAIASSGRPAGFAAILIRIVVWAAGWTLQNLANILTLARLLCAVPLLVLVLAGHYTVAFWLFLAAAATDILDGFVAKHFNGTSRVGAVLDPAADKMLVACLFPTLALAGGLPLWLAVLAIARDVLIVAGSAVLRWRVRHFRVEPLIIGKLCTFLQLTVAGLALGELAGIANVSTPLGALIPITAAVIVLSTVAYVGAGLRLQSLAARSS